MNHIFDYLRASAKEYGEKIAVVDADGGKVSFRELKDKVDDLSAALYSRIAQGQPVPICMEKSASCVMAFLAVARLGAWYIPVDITLPVKRIESIIKTVSAKVVLARRGDKLPDGLLDLCEILYVEDLLEKKISPEGRKAVEERRVIPTDPLYAIFTSGSTGVPKGVITTHRALFSFIDAMGERFSFGPGDVLANQVPFYFDASTKDIFLTMKYGCTLYILPKKLFMLPKQLIEFLNEHRVTRIIWAPSLLCMVANFKVLEKVKPLFLRSVFFVGELMPTKQYNYWKEKLPEVSYVNLYGCTEVTGSSLYYIIERPMDNRENIPIGQPFGNMDVFLLDEENQKIVEKNREGEICLRGDSLTLGYFGEQEKTEKVFVQNPLNPNYPERIYRSGDIGRYNDFGELVYVCRKDFQIKRMGRRIELGDVEAALNACEGVERACCLFKDESQDLIAVYVGPVELSSLKRSLQDALPTYMLPSRFIKLDAMPINQNGKMDRALLKKVYVEGKEL